MSSYEEEESFEIYRDLMFLKFSYAKVFPLNFNCYVTGLLMLVLRPLFLLTLDKFKLKF